MEYLHIAPTRDHQFFNVAIIIGGDLVKNLSTKIDDVGGSRGWWTKPRYTSYLRVASKSRQFSLNIEVINARFLANSLAHTTNVIYMSLADRFHSTVLFQDL